MAFDDWKRFNRFPPASRPRQAKGGIKSATRRGTFGASWWAKRWIEVLESFDIGSRLGRGRSYARKGQVLSIDISPGHVAAKVQGSRAQPYQVNIKVRPLMEQEWKRLAHLLSEQALFTAKLLVGEMPRDIEKAFSEAGLSLFPETSKDISTACSCPDWSNPCKHVAAVYYLLGEAFDRDPFLIFKLRGIDRQEFTAILGEGRAAQEEPEPEPEPLETAPEAFWAAKPLPPDLLGNTTAPKLNAALPVRLGNLQFWRGENAFIELLSPSYGSASKQAEDLLFDDKPT